MRYHIRRLLGGLLAAAILLLCGCSAVTAQPSAASAASASPASASGATDLKVYCFSAGKADAILLYTDESAVLIDTGNSGFGKEICAYLEEQGISTLDYLILTHFDKDHVGGAAKVLKSVTVKNVLQSDCPKDSSEYEKYLAALDGAGLTAATVRDTLTFTLDGIGYTVDPPAQTDYAVDASNNSSLIVSATCGEKRFLFAGDAEDARLQEYLAENPGTCDFLKVPYHGHDQSSLASFLAAVQPAYAVITSSDDEPEDAAAVKKLQDAGAEVYLTRTAPVLAECDGETLTVQYAQ